MSRICSVLALIVLGAVAVAASAQTLVEKSVEARFQIDLKVPDATLKTFLPPGFTSDVASKGPAKDCNVRLVFMDRITVNGPDGKPIGKGTSQLAYFVAPVKDSTGAASQLVIGGITDNADDAPGPFGNYLLATTHVMRRTTSLGTAGTILDTQDWDFAAQSGEHLEMHIVFERGTGNRGKPTDIKFYSAKNPADYRISHEERVLDILRNTTTNPPDRVKKFSLKISGGSYKPFSIQNDKVLSWDNILWIDRSISTP